MADRKGSGDKPSEFFRVEATAHLTSELDKEFELNYPLIQKNGGELLEKIKKGEIPFFSFDINNKDRVFLNEIVITALSRAKDPEDYSFSIHGDSGHSTYKEAIETVIKFIKQGPVGVKRTPKDIEIDTDGGKLTVPINRFAIITPSYERGTKRPFSHDLAIQIKNDSRFRDETAKGKILRRETLNKGVSFGILLGFYAGVNINNTFDFFANPNFKKSLVDKFGAKVKIPSRARGEDVQTIAKVSSKLTFSTAFGSKPSFSPESYQEALNILMGAGFLNPDELNSTPYSFIPVIDTARARVVLKGATEAAQKIAPAELVAPERIDYIDRKYGNIATSEVITAYLEIN